MNSEFAIATHALVYVSHVGRCVSSEELAENICTNPARVRKVMARLVSAGLVESRAGAVGGYCPTAGLDARTLADVADALGTRLVSASWSSGDVDRECQVSSGMGVLMQGVYDDLDALCRRRLAQTTVGDVVRELFSGKGAAAKGAAAGRDD
jgi:DNA-binding IscR family transcriptional regulator